MAGYFGFSIGGKIKGFVVAKIGAYLLGKMGEYVEAKIADYLVAPVGQYLVNLIGNSLVTALIGEYLLASPIRHQLGYMFCYSSNIKDFRKQIEELKAKRAPVQTLVNVADMNGEDILSDVQTWLTRVNEIIEESQYFLPEESHVNTWWFNLKLRYQWSKQAKTKTAEVDNLKRDGKFDRVSWPILSNSDSRLLISKEIMKALQDDQINTIGIYGMAGVGKSTLVRKVGRQAIFNNLFDEVMMVVVSVPPNIKLLQGEIADMLGLKLDAVGIPGRAASLAAKLEKKRILVILDDIWEEIQLEAIGIRFQAMHKGSKIALTSRNLDVCRRMYSQKNFLVEVLPEQEAWNLFRKVAGDSVDSPDLNPLAVEVTKKCAGLPLAILTLAEALRGKDFSHWRHAANQLHKSNIPKKVFAILQLSYQYLGSDETKSFFLLCCLWPKDQNIAIEDLTRYGMGLGLFRDVCTVEEARARAHTLAYYLTSSCLLQDSFKGCVKMHDVYRDFAVSIASRDERKFLLSAGPGWEELRKSDKFKQYTTISLMSEDIHELPDELKCPLLQILLLQCPHPSLKFPNNFFSRMENLKVLDMSGMCFSSLPSTLKHLTNLCTLFLERCKLDDLSTIEELKRLEILSLRDSNIRVLPEEIGTLSHLRLLDLTRCKDLAIIPTDVLKGLSRLEELYMVDGFVQWENERQDEKGSNASLVELKDLTHLVNIEIDVPVADLWPEDLLLKNLSRFQISIGVCSVYPRDEYSNSTSLRINGSTLIKDGIALLLKRVEDLQLTEMKGLPNVFCDLDREGLRNLRCLSVKKCDEVEYFFNASERVLHVAFPNLEKLDLYCLPNLKEIFHFQLLSGSFCQQVCFHNLRVVKVEDCDRLENLFSLSIAKDLSKLVELEAKRCKIMAQIFSNEYEGDEVAVDRIVFPYLRSLKLEDLPNLKIFCSKVKGQLDTHAEKSLFSNKVAFPALEELVIDGVGNFEEIWHPQFPDLSFSQLKFLTVSNCNKVLNAVPFCLLPRLWSLEKLSVIGCHSMEEVVEVGRLGIEEGNITGMLSRLRKLSLVGLPRLKHMWWDYPHGRLGFQNLSSIQIYECNGLKTLFSPSIASSFMELQEVKIDSCKMMKTIIAKEGEGEENCTEIVGFPQLHTVVLNNVPKYKDFYTGRRTLNFPSLKDGSPPKETFTPSTPPHRYKTNDEAFREPPEEGNNPCLSIQPFFDNKENQAAAQFRYKELQLAGKLELSSTSMVQSVGDMHNYSIPECIECLDGMEEVEQGSDVYFFALDLFLKKEYREIFLELKRPSVRVAWLRRLQSDSTKDGATSK